MNFYYIFSRNNNWIKLSGDGKNPAKCSNMKFTCNEGNEDLKIINDPISDFITAYGSILEYKDHPNNLYVQANKFGYLLKYNYIHQKNNFIPFDHNKTIVINKAEKTIKVKGTAKRKAHKRRITFEGKKTEIKDPVIDYKESIKNMNDYILSLNQNNKDKEVLKSIKNYVQMGYIGINEYLKRGETIYFSSITEHNVDNTKKIISDIKNFLNNAPKYQGEVYRGVTYMMNSDKDIKKWDDFINNIEDSETITFSSFLSCSKNEKIANIFTNNYQKYSGKFNSCLMIIKTKSGVPIEKLSTSNEKEILLNFDKIYKISKYDKSNPNKIKLYLEEI